MTSLPIRFSPLIYTSLPGSGFGLQASRDIPAAIQEIFLEKIVNRHWNAYAPPEPGSRAVYLHQTSLEDHLFGWLYCDGQDDFGRGHVPYFLAYYYRGLLNFQQMETILTYLQFGPETMPISMEPILAPNLWNYEPSRPGVRIPVPVREELALESMMGKLLDLYVPENKIFGWELRTTSAQPLQEPLETKRHLAIRRKANLRIGILVLVSGAALASGWVFFAHQDPPTKSVQPQLMRTEQIENSTQLEVIDPPKPRKRRRRSRHR